MKRVFKIGMSERCYRFKPDALPPHAPQKSGVYEFVIFDSKLQPIVLYVGLAHPGTIYEALSSHLMGRLRPTADELFKISRDVYFDYVSSADVASDEEYKDIAAGLITKHQPRLNAAGAAPTTGKYSEIVLEEVD